MIYFQGTTDFSVSGPSAVTLGKFDGVHRGHQKLIRRIRSYDSSLASVVFSLNGSNGQTIYTAYEQKLKMEQMGVDTLISCPFVPEISGMEPEEFIKKILVDRLSAKYIAVGTDFRFGYKRSGDGNLLRALQDQYGFAVEIIEKEMHEGREISSTYVREEISLGHMEKAAELLGSPFYVNGIVLHGRKIGRTLGMPTVNLIPSENKLLPPNGVYATRTLIDGVFYQGITNIGYKPTVGERFRGVETYLFDVDLNLYEKEITTFFYGFEREEMKFNSLDELKAQMHRDIAFGKEYFHE